MIRKIHRFRFPTDLENDYRYNTLLYYNTDLCLVLCTVIFTIQTCHVHVHRPGRRRYVFPIRKRRFNDDFQLRFHIYYGNGFYVHAAHASIITV